MVEKVCQQLRGFTVSCLYISVHGLSRYYEKGEIRFREESRGSLKCSKSREFARPAGSGSLVASAVGMSFATLVDRVRFEFMEMPGLELTVAQAGRLWNMGADDCRFVIDSLVDTGFLRWTTQRTIVRTGRA
jgi:hypothetical protein